MFLMEALWNNDIGIPYESELKLEFCHLIASDAEPEI